MSHVNALTRSLEDPVFATYAAAVSVLAIHLFVQVAYVIYLRASLGIFINPEDAPKAKPGASKSPTRSPAVAAKGKASLERALSAHRNSVENSVVFFTVGLLYSLTGPELVVARTLFVAYVASRLLHAVFYLRALQPFRSFSFTVGALIQTFMAANVLYNVLDTVF